MLGVGTTPSTHEARGTGHLAVGVGRDLKIAAGGVVDAGLLGVHEIPV